jgi:hypothetical protein
VRHRAKLVAVRTGGKCQVPAVLAAGGVPVRMSDLFGPAGTELLDHLQLPTAFAARVNSLRRLLEALDAEIARVGGMVAPGWPAIAATRRSRRARTGAGSGAGRRDRRRHPLPGPAQLASWVGLTLAIASPTPTSTAARSPSRAPGWPAGQPSKRGNASAPDPAGAVRDRVAQRRGRNIGVVAAARELICLVSYGRRDGHLRRLAA